MNSWKSGEKRWGKASSPHYCEVVRQAPAQTRRVASRSWHRPLLLTVSQVLDVGGHSASLFRKSLAYVFVERAFSGYGIFTLPDYYYFEANLSFLWLLLRDLSLKHGVVVLAYNPCTWELQPGRWGVPAYSQQQRAPGQQEPVNHTTKADKMLCHLRLCSSLRVTSDFL